MKKLLAAFACSLIAASTAVAGEYPDISVKELKKAIEAKKVAVIDVNGSASFKKGHIPGAIDYATTKDKLSKALPKDKTTLVVAYCGGPSCSAYKAGAKAVDVEGVVVIQRRGRPCAQAVGVEGVVAIMS